MFSTTYKIRNLVDSFKAIKDGSANKGALYSLDGIDRAPGSGIATDLIAHHQGMYHLDSPGSYVVTGSTKGNPSYFYLINNRRAISKRNGEHFWSIDDKYTHPGGIQVAENILVTGNEKYKGATTEKNKSLLRFFDIADPHNVKELKHLQRYRKGSGSIASAVALTKLGKQWLLAIRAQHSISFYSLVGKPSHSTSKFEYFSFLRLENHAMHSFQCIQLFFDSDGELHLFGMPNGSSNEDKIWLYHLKTEKNEEGHITRISEVDLKAEKHLFRSGTGKGKKPRFKYASCIHFQEDISHRDGTSSGAFIVYSGAAHVVNKKIWCNKWE